MQFIAKLEIGFYYQSTAMKHICPIGIYNFCACEKPRVFDLSFIPAITLKHVLWTKFRKFYTKI